MTTQPPQAAREAYTEGDRDRSSCREGYDAGTPVVGAGIRNNIHGSDTADLPPIKRGYLFLLLTTKNF